MTNERTDIQTTAHQVQRPAIHVLGLEKSYKDLQVLRCVDFDVAPGSIFALLGSNGAGKTTVVKILSTLLRADARHRRASTGSMSSRRPPTSASRSASPDSSPPSTRSSPDARTSC